MRKPEELSCIVTTWNETHPNRKDQPTLYFVIDRLLQNIVDALNFEVFEDNSQVLKFKCVNFPLVGELELKKKTNNLFLLFDLNPYSLVIDGEKRSREYTITSFKDDYKNRVAEFIFLHLDELKSQITYLHRSFLRCTLETLYTKEVSTQFVLDFNESYNKYEQFLNAVHSISFDTLGTEIFNNSVYGSHKYYKSIQMLECKHCSSQKTQDNSAVGKIEVSLKIYPVMWQLKDKKCFDNVFCFVKDNRKDLFREYSIRDLVNRNAGIYGKEYHYNSFVDTIILNKNTFKFIFPDSQFPDWCLMWAGCSVYITEEISDGYILFIQSRDDINGLKNAICIDKENNRFFVNNTSDSIIAFDVHLKDKDELIKVTDKISTGSIYFNQNTDFWLTSEKIIVETFVVFSDGKSESLLKTDDPFYQLVPSVTYLYYHAKKLEEIFEDKLKQLNNTPCLIMTIMSNPEHDKDAGKYIGVSKTFSDTCDNSVLTPIKNDIQSASLGHINSLKNKHRDHLLETPDKTLYDISPDNLFCAYGSIYNDIKKDIQIKRKELNLEIEEHIRLIMYFGEQDSLNHRNTLLMSTLLNVYFLMQDRVVDELIISDTNQRFQMDEKILDSVTTSMKKFGAEDNFKFSYDIEVL